MSPENRSFDWNLWDYDAQKKLAHPIQPNQRGLGDPMHRCFLSLSRHRMELLVQAVRKWPEIPLPSHVQYGFPEDNREILPDEYLTLEKLKSDASIVAQLLESVALTFKQLLETAGHDLNEYCIKV